MTSKDHREEIEQFIFRLIGAIKVCRTYGIDHQLSQESLDILLNMFDQMSSKKQDLTLGIIGDEIVFDNAPFPKLSKLQAHFIDHLKAIGVERINIEATVNRDELSAFVKILGMRNQVIDEAGGIDKVMNDSVIRHISVGQLHVIDETQKRHRCPQYAQPIDIDIDMEMAGSQERDFIKKFDVLKSTFQQFDTDKPLDSHAVRQIVTGLVNSLVTNKNLLFMLSSIRLKEEDMYVHSLNVAIFTLLQAEMLGLDQKYLADIAAASLFHDITRLYSSEKKSSQVSGPSSPFKGKNASQAIRGAKMLLEAYDAPTLAAIVAFESDIPYDMSGPLKKKYGEELNIVSMMISISDYYDTLRRRPAYFDEGGPESLYEEMLSLSGKKFHPDILNNFFTAVGVYPPGTLVELDNHEIGLVVQANVMDIRRPYVEILYSSGGVKIADPRRVNLLEKDRKGQFKRTVVKSVSPKDQIKIPKKYM